MLATNHTLTGIAIAVSVHNSFTAAVLAFFSHFALDAVPHFGNSQTLHPGTRQFIYLLIGDIALGSLAFFTSVVLWQEAAFGIFFAVTAALAPDFLHPIKWFFGKVVIPPFQEFHSRIQWSETPQGIIVEAVWFTALSAFLFISANGF